jgi:hypothetical protein
MYCLEYLEKNFDWLRERLEPYVEDGEFAFRGPPACGEEVGRGRGDTEAGARKHSPNLARGTLP